MFRLAPLVTTITATFVLAGCSGSSDGGAPDATVRGLTPAPELRTIDVQLGDRSITVEVADDPEERVQGLSDREGMAADSGLLFVWEEEGPYQLWMKGMRFPLDFVWLDASQTVIEVHENVQPQPGAADAELKRYAPDGPSRFVIELNAGAAARLGIDAGDVLVFDKDSD